MPTPPFTTLSVQRDAGGAVLRLLLDRPEVRNAMSLAMVAELRQALTQAEHDGATRVLVLRGAGGHFCSGGDLRDMAAARATPPAPGIDPIAEVSAAFGELCLAFADTPLATVAVLEGTVMGGGFGLACVADVAIASEDVSLRLPETSLGLVPAQIAPFLLQRLGYGEARRLAVSAARLDARQALALRLVHELHPAPALDEALARVLHGILQSPPGAIAATKALLARARQLPPAQLVPEAAAVFAEAVRSAEGVEGTTAFLHKRRPAWAPQ